MDGISNDIVNVTIQMQSAQLAQAVQLGVLKKALDLQGAAVQNLLQPLAGPLPLATSGSLGTRLNVMA